MDTIWYFVMATWLSYVLADVQFIDPAPGVSFSGTTISMDWKDSGNAPAISELANYEIFLCAGGDVDADYIQLATLVTSGDFANGNNASSTFVTSLGANVKNAYFLKMISAATGGSVINFSGRFSLQSMDGTFPAVVTEALKTVSGTDGPPTENDITSGRTSTLSLSSSRSIAVKTSTSATSGHPSTTFTSTPASTTHGSSLGAGAGAGITTGILIVLMAFAFAIYYCLKSKRMAASQTRITDKPQLEDTSMCAVMRNQRNMGAGIYELPADQRIHELAPHDGAVRHELDGKQRPLRQVSAKELRS